MIEDEYNDNSDYFQIYLILKEIFQGDNCIAEEEDSLEEEVVQAAEINPVYIPHNEDLNRYILNSDVVKLSTNIKDKDD